MRNDPYIWIVNSTTGTGEMSAFFFCGWENTSVLENSRASAVEEYKKSVQNNRFYDIIVLSDVLPNRNGPEVVRGIRDLGYKGYIISVARSCSPSYAQPYLDSGANKVVASRVRIDDCREVIKGECARLILVSGLYKFVF